VGSLLLLVCTLPLFTADFLIHFMVAESAHKDISMPSFPLSYILIFSTPIHFKSHRISVGDATASFCNQKLIFEVQNVIQNMFPLN
jgi:hypothetical protein